MKTILATLASLATAAATGAPVQGRLELKLSTQYDRNYGANQPTVCATNYKHKPDPEACDFAGNSGFQLFQDFGIVAKSGLNKQNRQRDFEFAFSWPVSTDFSDVTIFSLPPVNSIRASRAAFFQY